MLTRSKKKEHRENGLFSSKIKRVSFIGVCQPRKKTPRNPTSPKKRCAAWKEMMSKPNLLFHVVEKRSGARIRNLLQFSCAILGGAVWTVSSLLAVFINRSFITLGMSKCIYLGAIRDFLVHLDARKAELM